MPISRSATSRKRPKQTKPYSGPPTYPRWDLLPPEHVIRSLASWGRVVLAVGHLTDEDRATVERAIRQLNDALPEQHGVEMGLFGLLKQVTAPAAILERLFQQIETIAGAAYLIGAHGAMTESSRVFFQRGQADWMRLRRKASTKEQCLREAIEAEIKVNGRTIPSQHPYKDAGIILEGVNKRLAPRVVSVDAIYRRLKS
jgi:hypothetical protein